MPVCTLFTLFRLPRVVSAGSHLLCLHRPKQLMLVGTSLWKPEAHIDAQKARQD